MVGGCHALVYVENSLVGDPMETAALHAIGWSWNRSDVATAKGGRAAVRVAHRYARVCVCVLPVVSTRC